jgi:hypothetical protein
VDCPLLPSPFSVIFITMNSPDRLNYFLSQLGDASLVAHKTFERYRLIFAISAFLLCIFAPAFFEHILDDHQLIFLVIFFGFLSHRAHVSGEIYKNLSDVLNVPILDESYLPFRVKIPSKVEINIEIKRFYNEYASIYKCPIRLNIPNKKEFYDALVEAEPDGYHEWFLVDHK